MNLDKKKKTSERISLDKLILNNKDFPKGKIENSECPDFLILNSKRKLGIEIVQLFQDLPENILRPIAIEHYQDNIVREAIKIYESKDNPPLVVQIIFQEFPETIKLTHKYKTSIAEKLANVVIDNLPPIEGISEITCNNFGCTEELYSISILRNIHLTKNNWSITRAGDIIEFFIQEIQKAIDDKNRKYVNYMKHCDECWLIIDAPGDSPSSFFEPNEDTLSYIYKSFFTRVYFVGGFGEDCFELKIINKQ